ncbi:hypothetical protein HZ992_19030 [Rhizobacter sp. AJA081-3]|uniref:hypothetical protein n=1 Tax=Rhizobacter sp. AJA081-3 TaxID=2753607 RepID=UPI001AE09F97|nr:hypothetical protein [Rhizobacter sp. AJA081-3]QTN22235.1 hypothetical protein HZ992_19030 [Rhizobacter sp. AJA081-3]
MDETDDQEPEALAQLVNEFPRVFKGLQPSGSYLSRGWVSLVRELVRDIDALIGDEHDFRILQLKEKFGTLRFYYQVDGRKTINADLFLPDGTKRIQIPPHDVDELFVKLRERVARAETDSAHICERCGAPGVLQRSGWWKVRCAACKDAQ